MGRNITFVFILVIVLSITSFNQSFGQADKFSPTIKPQVWGHVHYSNYNDESTGLIKRARFGAKGSVYKDINYAFLFEAVSSPYLLQAWIDYNFSSVIKMRIGQYKYPFGLEAFSSATLWKFINPSFVTNGISKKLGNSGASFRDMGIQASGSTSLTKFAKLNYAVMLMNGNGINQKDDNKDKDIALRSSVMLYDLFNVGISYFKGNYTKANIGTFDENSVGLHLQSIFKLNNRELRLQGEYLVAKYYDEITSYRPWGYYFYSTYNVFDKVEAGIRYDYFEKDKFAENILSQSRVTFSAGYYFTKKQRINLNYEIIDDDNLEDSEAKLTVQFQYAIQ